MSEVKRVEAQGLLRELKDFAFASNEDFKDGRISGVEEQKAFYYPTTPILDEDGNLFTPYRKTTVGFSVDRQRNKIRNHHPYVYSFFTSSERSIHRIPEHIWNTLSEEADEDDLEHLKEIETDSLSESATLTLGTSDFEVGEISMSHSYDICVAGEPVYERSDDDLLYDVEGEYVDIPTIESDDNAEQLFVEKVNTHEKLDTYSRILNEIAFHAIIDPFDTQDYEPIVHFRDAADRMRVIMEIMRHGINVKRLYDLE